MNLYWISSIIFSLGIIACGGQATPPQASTSVELLERALAAQRWPGDEQACYRDLRTTLQHAKNFTLWAVWVLDSVAQPSGQLFGAVSHPGNYDECMSPHRGFDAPPHAPRFQYCMTGVTLANLTDGLFSRDADVSADIYLSKKTSLGRSIADMMWGGCVPVSCPPRAAVRVARALLSISHLAPLAPAADIKLLYCRTNEPDTRYSTGFQIFAFGVIGFAFVTVCLSYYHSKHEETSNTFVGEVARSFCLRRNLGELTKLRDNEIFSMNLMRIVSSIMIIGGHTIFMIFYKLTANTLNVEQIVYDMSSFILHMDICTDTFFAMSGLLFMKGLFTDKHKSPLKYIWKRYIRLIVTLALVTAYVAVGINQQADGPLLKSEIPTVEVDACINNWWQSLLMISNYVDPENMCNIVAWYVPCDFQLSVLTTLIFLAYKRNKSLGRTLMFGTIAVGTVQLALSVLWSNISPIPFVGSLLYPRYTAEFTDVYVKPFTHAAPFMIGAMTGYILYKYKPTDYRKRISQTSSIIGVALSVCAMSMCLYGGYYYFFVTREVAAHSVAFAAFNRALWSIAVCSVIVICEYGQFPALQNAMAWFPLVPISRLSYPAYLLQFPILLYYVGSIRTQVYFDMFHMTLLSTAMSVLCYASSFAVWMLLEAPLINLNNMLTYKTWKNNEPIIEKVTSNGTHKSNGKHL